MIPARRDLVIGTAGHIDHGKTALVRALTGVDTDRLPDEKKRGITIDLGFAALDLGGRRASLVDVPGHERFIRNMVAGASGLDLALLVVAGDDSVMPQTREHLEILGHLGLSGGLVALTKCDLAEPSWLALVEDDVRALVAGTFLGSCPIVRTSATSGLGIEALRSALAELCDRAPPRDDPGPFRMAIDRSFAVAGHGTVVTGTVVSGEVGVGDDLEWLPSGRVVRVRGLHRHDRPAERIARGSRAAINLVGVRHAEVARGHELATPGYLVPSRLLAVEVRASASAESPLRHRGRYRLHLGTAEVPATLALLGGAELGPSEIGLAQLELAEAVAASHGQPFVIRRESPPATLGGGRVLRPALSRTIRRRDRAEVDRLLRLGSPDPSTRLVAALASAGWSGLSPLGVVREAGIPSDRAEGELALLRESGRLVPLAIGPRRSTPVAAEVVDGLECRVLRALDRLHRATPRHSAIARARVASALADLGNDGLVSALIDRLKAHGKVVADSRAVALAGFEPKLSQSERKLKREIAEAYRAGGFAPPDPSEWGPKAGPRAATVAELLALLVEEGQIVEVGPGFYLDHDFEAELRRRVAARLAGEGSLTMAEIRDLLETSRKFAVPIGEYLDRIGWTRRVGDDRTAGPRLLAERGES